ncbi:MAG: metallophosphoesterase family protein [Candidatus Geothermarchaeales archaeon]
MRKLFFGMVAVGVGGVMLVLFLTRSPVFTFVTSDRPSTIESELRFVVAGGLHADHGKLDLYGRDPAIRLRVLAEALNQRDDFKFMWSLGDQVCAGDSESSWEIFNSNWLEVAKFPVYYVAGNHDGSLDGFFENYTKSERYYSLDLGGIHFVALGFEGYFEDRVFSLEQELWLQADLSVSHLPTIIMTHMVYDRSIGGGSPSDYVPASVRRIIEDDPDVKAVFGSHYPNTDPTRLYQNRSSGLYLAQVGEVNKQSSSPTLDVWDVFIVEISDGDLTAYSYNVDNNSLSLWLPDQETITPSNDVLFGVDGITLLSVLYAVLLASVMMLYHMVYQGK